MIIVNGKLTRIDAPASVDVAGQVTYATGDAIDVDVTIDEPTGSQRYVLGAAIKDATAVVYVETAEVGGANIDQGWRVVTQLERGGGPPVLGGDAETHGGRAACLSAAERSVRSVRKDIRRVGGIVRFSERTRGSWAGGWSGRGPGRAWAALLGRALFAERAAFARGAHGALGSADASAVPLGVCGGDDRGGAREGCDEGRGGVSHGRCSVAAACRGVK